MIHHRQLMFVVNKNKATKMGFLNNSTSKCLKQCLSENGGKLDAICH